MTTSMNNKIAIITGASGGLGRAIAKELSSAGWSLVLNGRNEAKLQQVANSLSSPEKVRVVASDISVTANLQNLVDTTIDEFGKLDALVNNAGAFAPKPFLEVTEDDLDLYLNTNLKSTFFLSQAAIRHMVTKGGGAILNIGTVLVDHALGGFPASAAVTSKGAVHALTMQLAAEFGKENIRVNTIAPGIIRTPLHAKNGIEDSDSLAGLHLVNRIGEPQQIATMARQAIENDFMSGSIINVDGGHVAGHHLG